MTKRNQEKDDELQTASSKKWMFVGFEEILWVSKYKIRGFHGPL